MLFSSISLNYIPVNAQSINITDQIAEIGKNIQSKDKSIKEKAKAKIGQKINTFGLDKAKKLNQKFNDLKNQDKINLEFSKLSDSEKEVLLLTIIPVETVITTDNQLNISQRGQSVQDRNDTCATAYASANFYNYYRMKLFTYTINTYTCWNGNYVYNGSLRSKNYVTYSFAWRFVNHRFDNCRNVDSNRAYDCVAGGEFEGGVPSPWGTTVLQRSYPVVETYRTRTGYLTGGGWFE